MMKSRKNAKTVLKNIINKDLKKQFKGEKRRIVKLYSKFFSKPKYVFYRIIEVASFIAILLLPIIVNAILIIFGGALKIELSRHLDVLKIISDCVFYIGTIISACATLSIIISACGNNEYFGTKEGKIFFKMKTLGYYNFLFIPMIIINLVLLIIAYSLKDFVAVISSGIDTIVYSAALAIYFLVFKCKNSVDQYFMYLKSRNELFVFKKSSTIKDFRFLLNKDNLDKGALVKQVLESGRSELRLFDNLLEKLELIHNKGVNISQEQNIIEGYISKLSKRAKSPQQLILVQVFIETYFKKIMSMSYEQSNIKPITASFSFFIKEVANDIDRDVLELLNFSVDHKKFNYGLINPTDYISITEIFTNIIDIQGIYSRLFEKQIMMFSDLNNDIFKKKKRKDINLQIDNLKQTNEKNASTNANNLNVLTKILENENKFYKDLLTLLDGQQNNVEK